MEFPAEWLSDPVRFDRFIRFASHVPGLAETLSDLSLLSGRTAGPHARIVLVFVRNNLAEMSLCLPLAGAARLRAALSHYQEAPAESAA